MDTAAGSTHIRKAEKGRFQAVGAVFAKTLEAPEGTACQDGFALGVQKPQVHMQGWEGDRIVLDIRIDRQQDQRVRNLEYQAQDFEFDPVGRQGAPGRC